MLAALVVAVFGLTVGFGFVQWDDDTNVTGNPHLATGSLSGLSELWSGPYAGLYVPVTYTWWWAERILSRLGAGEGPDPRIYHAGNVLLHLGCVWLVFLLLRRLLGSVAGALAGAALFAVHPIQAEVVSWVTASKDLLAALLSLTALLLHLRVQEGGDARLRAAALAAFAAALLAKPSAVVVPALALLIDVLWRGRSVKEAGRALIPWAALAVVLVVVTKTQQPDRVLRFDLPLWSRPLIALDALAFYLGKIVAPLRLLPDYGRTPAVVMGSGAAAWTWIVPVAVAAVVLRLRRDRRWTVPALWFLLALAPVLGLIPFEYQNISTVADRYAFLAMVGPALALGAIVAARPRREVRAAVTVLVAVLGIAAGRQAWHWRDTEALFGYTLAHQPASFSAQNNLGVALAKEGRYQDAIAHFDEVIRLAPGYFRAWGNRGNMREKLGDLQGAEADLREAVRLAPGYAAARLSLARVLRATGRDEEADEELRAAWAADPESADSHNSLGVEAFSAGDLVTAEEHFREAIRLRPEYAEAHNNLANCLAKQGRPFDALPEYEEALRIDPDYYSAHLNLGKLLMRSTDQAGAIRHLERALELGGPNPELARRIEELKARAAEFPPGAFPGPGGDAGGGAAGGAGDQSR